MSAIPSHVIVHYRRSAAGDDALREASELDRSVGARLTVLTVAVVEPVNRRCCDIRSRYWNQVMEERAREELDAASALMADEGSEVEFAVTSGSSVAAVLAREAAERRGDVIVVPRRAATRRLRRKVRRLETCQVMELPAARVA